MYIHIYEMCEMKINMDICIFMHVCVVRYVWSVWYPKCPGVHTLIMQSYSVGAGQVWRKKYMYHPNNAWPPMACAN